ncbi:hypothetical protein OB905_08440 [Halobacteria archaeon AArc-dxtr1]|nr:hypothetical protein [Halobacteria archaeon AArc-dxtr1]
MPEFRSTLRAASLFLASVLVVGVPAIFVLLSAFDAGLDAVGLEAYADSPAAVVVLWAASIFLGLQLAVEVAAVQTAGFEALGRGSPRIALVRTLCLTIVSLGLVAAITWGVLSVLFRASGPLPYALAALVGLCWLLVIYRVSTAFVRGVRT